MLTEQFDVSESRLKDIVADAVHGADDGELFLEYSESEALMFDNGRLKTANFSTDQGFGLRTVAGEASGYAHSSELSEAALLRASDAVSTVKDGYSGTLADAPARTNRHLYSDENPIPSPSFEAKAKLLTEIDGWLRNRDPRVRQVTASLASSWQHVEIVRGDGQIVRDIRPLVRVNRDKVMEIIELVLRLCAEPKALDEVLKGVFDHYGLNMDFTQYVLAGSTIKSYLTCLLEEGLAEALFEDNRLLWHAVLR